MTKIFSTLAVIVSLLVAMASGSARDLSARVLDAETGSGIADATITVDGRSFSSDAQGRFHVEGVVNLLRVRAPGYRREDVPVSELLGPSPEIRLVPFSPKALYLSFFGIGNAALRSAALKLIRETQLNAVVIDIKGDRGMLSYRSAIPLARAIGAQRIITIPDLGSLLRTLHDDGIYTIARIALPTPSILQSRTVWSRSPDRFAGWN